MNKKLSYHADKMKVVCILLAVVMAIALIGLIVTSVAEYIEYYENPYYDADDIYDIINGAITGILKSIVNYGLPLGASIYIYIKGKDRKTDLYRLFKIFVWTEVAVELYQLVYYSYDLSDGEFWLLLLPIIVTLVGLYCLKVGKYEFFKVACILFLVFPCILWIGNSSNFISVIIYRTIDITDGFYDFEDVKDLLLTIANFVIPIIGTVAYALLFFKVFGLVPSIEEQFKQLNAALAEGTISQEQYDEQRQKLLEEL